MRLFFAGYGYISKHVACLLPNEVLLGSVHSATQESDSVQLCHFDSINEATLEGVTHIVISIPSNEFGDPFFNSFAHILPESLKSVIYLSSNSVYGNHHGEWVKETSSFNNPPQAALHRIKAENQWLDSTINTTILRLSAIYGPGRSMVESIKQNKPIIYKENQVFSRTHKADVANVIKTVIEHKVINEIFNVSDDHPSSSLEVAKFITQKHGLKMPPVIDWETLPENDPMKHYFQNSKKVSNQKLKDYFEMNLEFSSYRDFY